MFLFGNIHLLNLLHYSEVVGHSEYATDKSLVLVLKTRYACESNFRHTK